MYRKKRGCRVSVSVSLSQRCFLKPVVIKKKQTKKKNTADDSDGLRGDNGEHNLDSG